MNREILFRGKEVSSQKWVYGFYVHVPCGRFGKDEHIIQTISKNGRMATLYDVNSSTVGQFTGVTDKNGNKIFEGDIVDILCENEETGLIEWDKDTARFIVSAYSFEADFDNYYGTDLEVIGNIHDNPELIKRDEQKN